MTLGTETSSLEETWCGFTTLNTRKAFHQNWCVLESPFTVTKRLNDLVYHIQLGSQAMPKVVHYNHLWKYKGKDHPCWSAELGATKSSHQTSECEIRPVLSQDLETSPSHVAEEPEMVSHDSSGASDTPEENVHPFHMPGVTENCGLRRSHWQHSPPDCYGHFVT